MTRAFPRLGLTLGASMLLMASGAQAGARYESAYCTKAADGSGYCYGSMLGFRNHSSPSTSIEFYQSSSGYKTVWVNYGTWSAACQPNATVAQAWPMIIGYGGYFELFWDAAGTCTALLFYSGSRYENF